MNTTRLFSMLTLVFGISALSACGSGGDSNTTTSSSIETTVVGSVFKGKIDGATILISDAGDTVLANGGSTHGKFALSAVTLPGDGDAVFIESQGGQYTDEATGEAVSPGSQGLMTVFTAAELRSLMNDNKVIALTPETTLMAMLVKSMLVGGMSASEAIAKAKQTVQTQLIDGTNPVMMLQGDTLLLVGDLSTEAAQDASEALARNRATSYAYEAESFNLAPVQVFDFINKRALDLQDGTLDGKENGSTALALTDKNGNSISLASVNQNVHYGLARARLLETTIARFSQGQLSAGEKASLQHLGFDLDYFNRLQSANQTAESATQTHLSATNLPAFNHLPILGDEDGNPNDQAATYTLTATLNVNVTINTPGQSWITPMLRYNGSALPLIIKAKRGDFMTLNLVNNLSDETTIHWHGFEVPGVQDGGPDFPVAAGSSKTYSFSLVQPAAPLWFHPHPDMKTGEQVYRGLAGVFLLEDEISTQLTANRQLPSGAYDIPVLVQDRRFNSEAGGVRELAYMTQEMDSDGMLGDRILVNGAELPKLDVDTRQYRLRIYNTSNARSYDFALSNGATFKVVGTDGGLLPEPVEVDHILLGAAERAEIVVDFGAYSVGDKVMLISRAFNGDTMNLMGMMDMNDMGMMANSVPNGQYLNIMRFDVAAAATDDVTLYTALPAHAEINAQRLSAADATKTRDFVMTMTMGAMNGNMGNGMNGGMNGMTFIINGKSFDMNRIDEVVTLSEGNTEIWSLQNMSPMAHPFHAHAIQWQVLDRDGIAASGVDRGWKDTVLVQPGETVRFIGRFDPAVNVGDYMYHCHILEHEDAGMMGFFRIQ